MATIDLDAARAARAKAEAEAEEPRVGHTVRFKKKTFVLPVEIPWSLIDGVTFENGTLVAAGLRELFGDDYDVFASLKPTTEDMIQLATSIVVLEGIGSLGESRASDDSSTDDSSRSRPTSNGSTGSTSGKRSGGKKGKASGASEA